MTSYGGGGPTTYAEQQKKFSLQWYGRAFSNPLITSALATSLTIAGSTAVIASIIGTLTALGLERASGWPRHVYDALIYIAIMGAPSFFQALSVWDRPICVNPGIYTQIQ